MKGARIKALWSILRGVLAAAAATLLGMLLLAAAVIYLDVTDGALAALNAAFRANIMACIRWRSSQIRCACWVRA